MKPLSLSLLHVTLSGTITLGGQVKALVVRYLLQYKLSYYSIFITLTVSSYCICVFQWPVFCQRVFFYFSKEDQNLLSLTVKLVLLVFTADDVNLSKFLVPVLAYVHFLPWFDLFSGL